MNRERRCEREVVAAKIALLETGLNAGAFSGDGWSAKARSTIRRYPLAIAGGAAAVGLVLARASTVRRAAWAGLTLAARTAVRRAITRQLS
mgnify:CR=1 FL=1